MSEVTLCSYLTVMQFYRLVSGIEICRATNILDISLPYIEFKEILWSQATFQDNA